MEENKAPENSYELDQEDMMCNQDFKKHVDAFAEIPDMRGKMRYVLGLVENYTVVEEEKDLLTAIDLQVYGDEQLEKSELKAALKFYTDALKYIPHVRKCKNNPIISNAYGARSEVLLRMKMYPACIRDIDRALQFNPIEERRRVLVDNKQFCLNHMKPALENML